MSIGARVFVALIYFLLGLSFIATTAILYNEFRDAEWFSLAVIYSHVFVFFPIFGIAALFAFYIPSSIFVDLYWNHVPYGRYRFMFGFIAVSVASYFIAQLIMKGDIPAIWQVPAQDLKTDRGNPPACGTDQSCLRISVLNAVASVRKASQSRIGLSPFARQCDPDPFLEAPPDQLAKRFCFVTQSHTTAGDCCKAQIRFRNALAEMYRNGENESLTGLAHKILLPLKVFFLLVLLVTGILLAVWRRTVEEFYRPIVGSMERDIIIGGGAMLVWPVMNHAFLQSISVLYGVFGKTLYAQMSPVFSILFGAWLLMLIFFFFRRYEKDTEAAAKITGVIGSAVAIIKYNEIIDFAERYLGSGSTYYSVGVLAAISVFGLISLFPGRKPRETEGLANGSEDIQTASATISIEKPPNMPD